MAQFLILSLSNALHNTLVTWYCIIRQNIYTISVHPILIKIKAITFKLWPLKSTCSKYFRLFQHLYFTPQIWRLNLLFRYFVHDPIRLISSWILLLRWGMWHMGLLFYIFCSCTIYRLAIRLKSQMITVKLTNCFVSRFQTWIKSKYYFRYKQLKNISQ